jgi:hypothetical protein
MTESGRPIRVISATRRKDGAAVFNQVVMLQDTPPRGLLLVAVDPSSGLHMWMKPFSVVAPNARNQAAGYSQNLRIRVDAPPDWLGPAVEIPAAEVDSARPGLWRAIVDARTNTKNKLVRDLFGF